MEYWKFEEEQEVFFVPDQVELGRMKAKSFASAMSKAPSPRLILVPKSKYKELGPSDYQTMAFALLLVLFAIVILYFELCPPLVGMATAGIISLIDSGLGKHKVIRSNE